MQKLQVKHLDVGRINLMNKYLRKYSDKTKLHESALKIQKSIFGKIKRKKAAKDLR